MSEIVPLTDVQRALAEVETPADAKDLYDKLETLSQYATRYRLDHEKQNEIAEAKLRTARRGGYLLRDETSNDPTHRTLPKGFSRAMSSRWQTLARLDDDEFERFLAETDELTLAAALNRAGRGERDRRLRRERKEATRRARETIANLGDGACRIQVADIRRWLPRDVSCIVTDPPYITEDAVELHSALADFALAVLPEHGAFAVMTWQPILPAVLEAMARERLVYRWTAAWCFDTPERTPERTPRVFDGWKPVLVFHKDGWTEKTTYLYDTIRSRDADKGSHEWGQSVSGFRQLVRELSEPGDLVCDPFVGGGTTAIAALAETRRFVGCDIDPAAVATAQERLAA